MLFCCKKNSKKNSVLAFQQFLQKKESINGEKNELICMLKKFKEKNWCNNFDYNDGQCKNSVITKQCNSSARWQKQTNNLVIIKKKNSSRKSDFLWKIPSWFYDISIFHEKNTLHPNKSFKNTTKKKNGQKMAKNGQKISFYLLTFNKACLIHLTKISKKCQKYVICMLVVSQSCLLILIL